MRFSPQAPSAPSAAVESPLLLLRRGDAPHSDRAVRSGELTAVMRGVYVPTADWKALAPWDRYLVRVHAAALRYPGAVFCGESAAVLRGLPVFLEPRDVHLVAPDGIATARSVAGVRFHTADRMPEWEEMSGKAVVTAADAAVDIARSRHHAIGLATAGAVLRQHPSIAREMLAAINEKRASTRGRRHARWVIDRATGVPESTQENISLAVIEWLGFPAPELQQWVGDRDDTPDRLDFLWREWSLGGEADGHVKYSGDLGDAREALRARAARDARLLSRGIRATAHWTWEDAALSAQLRSKLLAIGLPVVAPEDTVELRSLALALGFRTPRPR